MHLQRRRDVRVLAVPRPALRADRAATSRRFWTPSRRAASPTATSRVAPTCFLARQALTAPWAPEHIIPTHGAAGANALVLSTLVNPGDHVVSVMPTYQQLYSIPEMCGAAVDVLHLEKENGLPRGRGGPGRPVHAGDEGHLHQQSRQPHGCPARRRDAAGHRGGGAQERRVAALRRGVPPLEPDRRVRRVGRRPLRQGASPPAP